MRDWWVNFCVTFVVSAASGITTSYLVTKLYLRLHPWRADDE